jgi:hypothetical protein
VLEELEIAARVVVDTMSYQLEDPHYYRKRF